VCGSLRGRRYGSARSREPCPGVGGRTRRIRPSERLDLRLSSLGTRTTLLASRQGVWALGLPFTDSLHCSMAVLDACTGTLLASGREGIFYLNIIQCRATCTPHLCRSQALAYSHKLSPCTHALPPPHDSCLALGCLWPTFIGPKSGGLAQSRGVVPESDGRQIAVSSELCSNHWG